MKKEKLSNQKGSITLFVLLAMLFFLVVVVNMFMKSSNSNQAQISEYDKLKQEYDESIENIDSIYTETEKKDKIKEYTEDGVPIPKGFYYVGGTKEEGVVISDNKVDENKGTSHNTATRITRKSICMGTSCTRRF